MFSLITLAATVPMLATSTLQLQDTAQNTSDKGQGDLSDLKREKCHLFVRVAARMAEPRKQALKDHMIILRDGQLRLNHKKFAFYHPFTGYFLPYPDTAYEGIVTTVNAENMLNWMYVDSDTYQVKYGVRSVAGQHLTVPMKLVSVDSEQRIIFHGFEGFVAVEELPGDWALYFDKDDNGLKDKVFGKKVTEIELIRTPLEAYKPTVHKEEQTEETPDPD